MDELNEEVGAGELNATVEEIDTRNETPKEFKRPRGPTIIFDVTRIRSLGDKKEVRYNEDGAPIELKDKIFTTVEAAFIIDPRSRKYVLQTAYEPQLLQVPPEKYSFIEQNHWEEFVRSRLSETFQKEGSNEVYIDRAKMWKKARVNKQGQYDNDNIQQVVHKIHEISMNTDSSSVNRHCLNDVLTQALGTKEHNGRVRGIVGYVTPTTQVSELEAQIRSNLSTPLSAHGSCSRPIMLEGIEEKGKRIEVESLDKPKENEKKGKEVMKRGLMKMPIENEVVCESTSTLPLTLKSILKYAEKGHTAARTYGGEGNEDRAQR
ncbi:putative serine/threonine-protein kinase nek2 [Cucumis melo var. makuwa]|uniref:Putative serine/threonine-protein kinase nek2 n=1 Tax=Cucumis melo var. makuwa TaxID=1194695 RepID=A0A5D3BI87_CUCMM|nr:putative serine/threonine-protein kinase nek2 [Cucumis melo var. makuwa]